MANNKLLTPGPVLAAARDDEKVGAMRPRYRREGMESATLHADEDGKIRDSSYTMLSTVGGNLARIRQILSTGVTQNPENDFEKLLPQQHVRDTDWPRGDLFRDDDGYHFCFGTAQSYVDTSFTAFRKSVLGGKNKDGCFITAPHKHFALDERSAYIVMQRLRKFIERMPIDLSKLSDALKRALLLNAMSSPTNNAALPKIPITIGKAIVNHRISLVVQLHHFDPGQLSTSVAIPLSNTPKNVEVPAPQSFFDFRDPEMNPITSTSHYRQQNLFQIATYVVSTLHLRPATPQQLDTTLAHISGMFDIEMLIRPDAGGTVVPVKGTGELAQYDRAQRRVVPTTEATQIASWLPNIEKIVDSTSAHLVVERINARYLQTVDLLLAWSDAATPRTCIREKRVRSSLPSLVCALRKTLTMSSIYALLAGQALSARVSDTQVLGCMTAASVPLARLLVLPSPRRRVWKIRQATKWTRSMISSALAILKQEEVSPRCKQRTQR